MESIPWNEFLSTALRFLRNNILGIILPVIAILAFGRVLVELVNRFATGDEQKFTYRKWIRYVTAFLAIFWVVVLYSIHMTGDTPLLLFIISIFLAAVAISMRDVFSNFVGWLIINSSKGFRAGDRIKVGSIAGDVIDIGILRTLIAEIGDWVQADQSTGRLITLPNSRVLHNEIVSYTYGHDFIWHEIRILVTFESNWAKAEDIMMEIAQKDFEQKKEHIQERLKGVRRKFLLRYNFISPKVYTRIADSGVELSLRTMVRARRRRTLEDALAREILRRFTAESDIEFAYPTMRIFRQGEGPQSKPAVY